ncbi:MbtH family protein [Parachlamydia acanthamoebae]|uniref:MbtH family protein n=1 Tax=Parachlamydia acanthamoebae TaxID=83552 RepID=UPI0009AD6454|nr:MbtH family NRPS accessory protein [Parachlamydia acanthamoebae]
MSINEMDITYQVVMNSEEQYSIWPTYKEVPQGWNNVGKQGTKQECLDFISNTWVDMRPLSVRKWLEENGEKIAAHRLKITGDLNKENSTKKFSSPTVEFLCERKQVVCILEKSPIDFQNSINKGFVYFNFPNTKGGTSVRVRIDNAVADSSDSMHLEGSFILDYVHLKCIAEVSLSNLKGSAFLHIQKINN